MLLILFQLSSKAKELADKWAKKNKVGNTKTNWNGYGLNTWFSTMAVVSTYLIKIHLISINYSKVL